jgi:hypothetical protein
MPRRPKRVGVESAADLARKIEVLEREMATQRVALERLKEMGSEGRVRRVPAKPQAGAGEASG